MVNYSAFHWSEKARKYAETLGTIFNVKGRVNTVSDLPSSGNKIGDVYLVGLVTDTDLIEYAWLSFDNVTRWEKLGSTSTSMAFSALTGSPYDNTALKNALDDKYDASNPNGYITGITSAMVTTALGYTPYNSSNPAGYTSNVGTVTSVNNVQPVDGNVTVTIPDPLPSQTGNAGKFLTTDGTDASWAEASTYRPDLFDSKWADHLLNDQNWLRADTFSWQDGTVYTEAYQHLVDDYANGTDVTETIGSYTITYRLAPDGHKIVFYNQSSVVDNIYNETGVAWYYIYDPNESRARFKLPRENPAREELIQVVRAKGNGIALGVTDGPNNYGVIAASGSGLSGRTGAYGENVGGTGGTENVALKVFGITTDSTKSGIISDMTDSTSVFKGKNYLYFYVGNFSQSAIEQTAGLNAELFNGKADVDLSNINASAIAKQTIVGWGMPDYDSGVTVSSSPYIPPKDGLFVLQSDGSTNMTISVNGNEIQHVYYSQIQDLRFSVPVGKGDIVSYIATGVGTQAAFFYPVKGE